MPPVVAVISAVASAIATISSWVISIGAFQFAIGKALLYVVGSMVMSAIARALSPTPEFDAGSHIDQGYEVSLKFDPAFPRQIVVGRGATGGSLAYAQVTGIDNKYLWRVAALSDNPSEGLDHIESDGETLTFDGDLTTGWRNCTSHFLKADGTTACLRVRFYDGTQTTADTDLVAATSEWTEACVGVGITYAVWRVEYDPEAFPSGEPGLTFVVDGALAYDPRVDAVQWTRNAELLAAQFARGWEINGVRVIGLGAADEDVPSAYVEEGADVCDEQVALLAGGTEDRYQANGLISSYDQPSAVLADFALAMAGQHIDSGGEIVMKPGRALTPVHLLGRALTDLDLLGDSPDEWTPDRPGDELCNTIHSTFVDPSAGWREQPLPIRKDTAAITEDGARFVKNRSYRFVTSHTQGQRLNKYALSDTRFQGRATIAVGLWGLAYEPGDWEEWTSAYFQGLTYKFRIEAVNFDINDGSDGSTPRARILLTIVETHASIDDWSTADEDQLTGEFPTQVPFTLEMSDITVTAAVLSLGGASVPQLRASWDAIESGVATSIEFEYRVVGDTVVYAGAASPTATDAAFDQGIMPAQTYEMRARLRALDRVGAWTSWTAHTGTTSSILIDNALVAEPFAPGRIGGSGNFVFALDKSGPSTTDVGEIYITADRFNHPDGTQRTSGLTGTVLTNYGEGVAGRFYLIYSQTAKATRFSGLAGSQGTATNIFAARIKASGGWEAFDDSGNVVDVTIASTDCILALVEAEGTASGLTGIAPMVSGAAGIDGVVATYAQTTEPSTPNVGDLWYDSDDANRRTYRWSGSAWVNIADQTPYNTAAAISGQGDLATLNRAALPFGANAALNSEFTHPGTSPPTGWQSGWAGNTGLSNVTTIRTGARIAIETTQAGTPANGTVFDIATMPVASLSAHQRYALPVTPGERVAASALLCHNSACANAYLVLTWYDASGAYVSDVSGSAVAQVQDGSTANPTLFALSSITSTAPANARFASLNFRLTCNGNANPKGWVMAPMLCRVPANQTGVPEYVPGPPDRMADQTLVNTAAAITGQGALATLSTVTQAQLAAGVGSNQLIDAGFRYLNTYWNAGGQSGSVAFSAAVANYVRYAQNAMTGVTVGHFIYIWSGAQQTFFQLAGGERIEASAYIGSVNCSSVTVTVQWFDSSNAYIAEVAVATNNSPSAAGAGDLSSYGRLGGFVTAPSNARYANIVVYATASTSAPTVRVTKPYLGRANTAQTELTPWSPGFEGEIGANVTETRVAASISGQGSGATANSVAGMNATDGVNLAASIAVSPNLIRNPTGRWGTLDFWAQNGDAAVVVYNEIPGRGRSFLVGYPASPSSRTQQFYTDYITIEAGANVSLQAQIDHYNRSSGSLKISVACYNSGGTYLSDALSETFTTDRYGAWSKSGTTPANTAKVRVVLDWTSVVGAGGGGSCVFRALKLERWAAPTRYSEENYLDGAWPTSGTFNVNGGASGYFDLAPYASRTMSSLTYNSCNWYGPGGQVISVVGATISGLSNGTKYYAFWDTVSATIVTATSPASYLADTAGRYLSLGSAITGSGGGGGGGGQGGLVP